MSNPNTQECTIEPLNTRHEIKNIYFFSVASSIMLFLVKGSFSLVSIKAEFFFLLSINLVEIYIYNSIVS